MNYNDKVLETLYKLAYGSLKNKVQVSDLQQESGLDENQFRPTFFNLKNKEFLGNAGSIVWLTVSGIDKIRQLQYAREKDILL